QVQRLCVAGVKQAGVAVQPSAREKLAVRALQGGHDPRAYGVGKIGGKSHARFAEFARRGEDVRRAAEQDGAEAEAADGFHGAAGWITDWNSVLADLA